MRKFSVAVACVLMANNTAVIADDSSEFVPESIGGVATLPDAPGAHWVWVSDMVWIAMPDGRATLVDADSGKMLGMLSTGYTFNSLSLPHQYGKIYSAETYYTRYTRGERTDVVTIYDARTLSAVDEIEIPPKRASTTPKLSTASITDDDRFMAVWNYTPAQSLSIVDLKKRKFAGEVPIPSCALAYPAGKRRFFTLCANGNVRLITLDDNGAIVGQTTSDRFFDATTDPVTEKGVRSANRWFFPSYEGVIHTLEIDGDSVGIGPQWSLVDSVDRKGSWRIGGIQHLAVHRSKNLLFALMHQGPKDTHHSAGTEVWVYDIAGQERIRRIALKGSATSIEVSQDSAPLLFTVTPEINELVVYDAITGEHRRTIPEISITPSLLQLANGN